MSGYLRRIWDYVSLPINPTNLNAIEQAVFELKTLTFNVKDYGATGNGTTDDTAAINSAINDATVAGGTVFVPAGIYRCANVTLKKEVILQGAGENATVLKLLDSSTGDVIQGDIANVGISATSIGALYDFQIRDLAIDGNKGSAPSGGYGIRFYGTRYHIDRVIIRACHGPGLYSECGSTSGYGTGFNTTLGTTGDEVHGRLTYVVVHDCDGGGVIWNGPHDSTFQNIDVHHNNAFTSIMVNGTGTTPHITTNGAVTIANGASQNVVLTTTAAGGWTFDATTNINAAATRLAINGVTGLTYTVVNASTVSVTNNTGASITLPTGSMVAFYGPGIGIDIQHGGGIKMLACHIWGAGTSSINSGSIHATALKIGANATAFINNCYIEQGVERNVQVLGTGGVTQSQGGIVKCDETLTFNANVGMEIGDNSNHSTGNIILGTFFSNCLGGAFKFTNAGKEVIRAVKVFNGTSGYGALAPGSTWKNSNSVDLIGEGSFAVNDSIFPVGALSLKMYAKPDMVKCLQGQTAIGTSRNQLVVSDASFTQSDVGKMLAVNSVSNVVSPQGTGVSTVSGGTVSITNGSKTITLNSGTWNYDIVGRTIQIAAGASGGGVLTTTIASLDNSSPTAVTTAFLATPVTGTTNGSASFVTLNWNRTTIASVVNSTTVTLVPNLNSNANAIDSAVLADQTNLEVHYGTDNASGITSWITDCRTNHQPGFIPAGVYGTSTLVDSGTNANGLTVYGEGQSVSIIKSYGIDTESTCGSFRITGTSATSPAQHIYLSDFRYECPTAHVRGSAGTKDGGIFLKFVQYFAVRRVTVDTCYAIAFNVQCGSDGVIQDCTARNSWADSFNINSSNANWLTTSARVSVTGCQVFNSGDDMFCTNGGRAATDSMRHIVFADCRGSQTRQHAQGRGLALLGVEDAVADNIEVSQTSGPGLDLNMQAPDHDAANATLASGTPWQLTFGSAPSSFTTNTTFRIFNPNGSATGYYGKVTAGTGTGPYTFVVDPAIPTTDSFYTTDGSGNPTFTGANLYIQWGTSYGFARTKNVNVSNILMDTTNMNDSQTGSTTSAAIRVQATSSDQRVENVRVVNARVIGARMAGVRFYKTTNTTTSDVTLDQIVRNISFDGLTVDGTGYDKTLGVNTRSSVTFYPGIYLQAGSNIRFHNTVLKDTYSEAIWIGDQANTNQIVSGSLDFHNIDLIDIGRSGAVTSLITTNPSTTPSGYTTLIKDVRHSNPSSYTVPTYIVYQMPNGGTIRDIRTTTNATLTHASLASAMVSLGVTAAAAPTTGAHLVGEVVWNATPAASGNMGWVCVTAGTPGTWQSFGSIAPLLSISTLTAWVSIPTGTGATVTIGTLPANSFVTNVGIFVDSTSLFNGTGSNTINVGFLSGSATALTTAADASSAGVKNPGYGASIGYNSSSQTVQAYYNGTGATTGKALVAVEYVAVSARP